MHTPAKAMQALSLLRRHDYTAILSQENPAYVIVSDPVRSLGPAGSVVISYEERSVHVDDVFRFIEERS